jgi:hypothetical protein
MLRLSILFRYDETRNKVFPWPGAVALGFLHAIENLTNHDNTSVDATARFARHRNIQ